MNCGVILDKCLLCLVDGSILTNSLHAFLLALYVLYFVLPGMEQAVAMNLTRSIGLSNFNKEQIESLLKIATIRPSLNQCMFSVDASLTLSINPNPYDCDNAATPEPGEPMRNSDHL